MVAPHSERGIAHMTASTEKRVLVVDDDLPTRRMIAAVLEHQKFVVDLCGDGQQAIVAVAQNDYGAVVLALVSADPDGDMDVLLRLKERAAPPRIILICAGVPALLEAPDSDLICARLRKPFEIDELVAAVESCF